MSAVASVPASVSASAKERERNKKKKERKRLARALAREMTPSDNESEPAAPSTNDDDIEIAFVPEDLDVSSDPRFADMASAFERFVPSAETEAVEEVGEDGGENKEEADADSAGEDEDGNASKFSKKKVRRAKRQTVAEIKRLVRRPDVVEWVDATAADPGILIELKSAKNTVPVPRHWSQKRKYLQGKRGIEKPPFELPGDVLNVNMMFVLTIRFRVYQEDGHHRDAADGARQGRLHVGGAEIAREDAGEARAN